MDKFSKVQDIILESAGNTEVRDKWTKARKNTSFKFLAFFGGP
jgi:hypothetical protein